MLSAEGAADEERGDPFWHACGDAVMKRERLQVYGSWQGVRRRDGNCREWRACSACMMRCRDEETACRQVYGSPSGCVDEFLLTLAAGDEAQ